MMTDDNRIDMPNRDELARNRLRAAITSLEIIHKDWPKSITARSIAISEVRHDLASVVTILMGGDADT